MARRKRAAVKTRTIYRAAPKKRRSKSRSIGGGSVQAVQVPAMIYGAARGYISNMLAPLTSKIPLGAVADEAGMIFANYVLAKNVKNPMIKKAAMSGLIIENARLGEAVVDGSLLSGLGLAKATAAGGNDSYFYG